MNPQISNPAEPQSISSLMRELLDGAAHEESISIGQILFIFGVRGFAFLILVLSLLNIVIFMVPLISILFGLPMIVLSAQMVLGYRVPIFPLFVRHRTIPRVALDRGLGIAISWVKKAERYVRPRFLFLSNPRIERLHGLMALMLAVMVTIPIPLLNLAPALALALLAIGLLQRDGVFVGLGYGVGVWCFFLFKSIGHVFYTL